jgi:metallo-beta-lactamase family protein
MSSTRLAFHGAAGTVTGSSFLLHDRRTALLVDCGLFQGLKVLRRRNWRPPPFDVRQLDGVLLTHAHVDHSGLLPRLVRHGFSERVFATHATCDLSKILLPDCARIQEEDALFAAKEHFSKHEHPEPLYTSDDAARVLRQFKGVDFDAPFDVKSGPDSPRVTFRPSGHILGAASVHVDTGAGRILFSGDIGRDDDLVMPPPSPPGAPDWIVLESTYGDREHPDDDPFEAVAGPVGRALERGGVVIVPAFAVARAQALVFVLHELMEKGRIPVVPIVVDSPMAIDTTELYCAYESLHDLTADECRRVFGRPRYARTKEESQAAMRARGARVIVSASGMLTGGRVLHHVKALGGDPNNLILLPGHQPAGTRGRALLDGARSLRIHGQQVHIDAEVVHAPYFSAHADRSQLLDWLGACEKPPHKVFLVHGEPEASESLRVAIRDTLGFEAEVPDHGEEFDLA